MKTLHKIALGITLATLFSSCQSTLSPTQVLSNQETRSVIMDSIANNSNMSAEMIAALVSSEHGNMAIMQNHDMMKNMVGNKASMIEMMHNNPDMMQNMIANMTEACKGDSSRMASMFEKMMENPQMKGVMQNMMNKNQQMGRMHGLIKQ